MVSDKGTYEHDELVRKYGGRPRRNLIFIIVAVCLLTVAGAYGYRLWQKHDIRARSVSHLPSIDFEMVGTVTLGEDDMGMVGPRVVLPGLGLMGASCKDRKFAFDGRLEFGEKVGKLKCDGDHPARLYMVNENYYLLMQNNFNKIFYKWRVLNREDRFVEIKQEDLPPGLRDATFDKQFAAKCYRKWVTKFFPPEGEAGS
jgi:hypothetical protein